MGSHDLVTADIFGQNGWPFLWPHFLEFGSFLALSGLDLASWQKVDLAALYYTLVGDFEHACVAPESCRIFPRDKNPDYEM